MKDYPAIVAKIIYALSAGPRSFGYLKRETATKKRKIQLILFELQRIGRIETDGSDNYYLRG